MALPTDLQFLDLNNATKEEVEHIKKILFGPNKKSLVEFPWQTGGKCCGCEAKKSVDCCNTAKQRDDLLSQTNHELSAPQMAGNVIYHEMPEQEPPIVPNIMCMTNSCTPMQGNTIMVTTGMPMPNHGMQAEFVSVPHPLPPHMLVSPHSVPLNTDIVEKGRGGRKVKKRTSEFSRNEKDHMRNEVGNVISFQDQHVSVAMPMNPRVTMAPAMVSQPLGYPMTLAPHNMQPLPYQFYPSQMMYTSSPVYNFVSPAMYSSYPANFLGSVAVTNDMAVQNTCTMHLTHCEVPQDVYDDKKCVPENISFCQGDYSIESQVPSENVVPEPPNEQVCEDKKPKDDCEKEETLRSQNIDSQIKHTETTVNTTDEVKVEENSDIRVTNVVNETETETLVVDSSNKPENVEVNSIENASSTFTNNTTPPVVKSEMKNSTHNSEGATRKTWASLFENSNSNTAVFTNSNPEPRSSVVTLNNRKTAHKEKNVVHTLKNEVVDENKKVQSKDSFPSELKEFLSTIQLDHHSVHIVPRGLINSGNWCYINATLQALLACPPFFNLMRKLPVVAGLKAKNSSSIPVIDSMVEFFHEFVPLPNSNKNYKNDVKSKEEFMVGTPFEPKYVYQMLRAIKSDSFKGKQEDAEEFLSCILNRLHEEMLEIISAANIGNNKLKNGDTITTDKTNLPVGDDDSDWLVMGYKNKSCITREVKCTPSPIFEIFGGTMRSMLQQAGSKNSATLQPFFTLQLDIQSESVTCIRSALDGLVVKESLQGFTSGNNRQEVEASRKITLEKLPIILILHLKRFVFDRNGGCRKLMKKVDIGIDLELSKDLLSSVGKSVHKQRRYRLFAVVYHDGQELAKGHYTTDVFHAGYKSWLRADDSNIYQISEANVMKHSPPRVPYLLYYRNIETIP